jgi:hypothetical protein
VSTGMAGGAQASPRHATSSPNPLGDDLMGPLDTKRLGKFAQTRSSRVGARGAPASRDESTERAARWYAEPRMSERWFRV